jgi:hypothetical protein
MAAFELGDGRLELVQGPIDDPGQDVGAEAPPDHRTRPRDRPGVVRQSRQAGQDGVADGVRDGRLADPAAVRPRVFIERREELFDVERDAVGAFMDRLDDVPRRRQLAAQDQRRRDRGLLEGQRPQPRLLRVTLAEEPRPPLAVDRAGRKLVGPVVAQDEQRPIRRVPGQLANHLEAKLVGPMEVLEDEQRRSVDRLQDPISRRADDQPPRTQRVAIMPAVDREQVL